MMRKIAWVVYLALYSIASNAQNQSIEMARREFRKGNYEDAVGLFNGAIATIEDAQIRKSLIDEKEKSSKCWQNTEIADSHFKKANFIAAKRFYENILQYNPADPYANNQKQICIKNLQEVQIAKLEKAKNDNLWIQLLTTNDTVGIKAFVSNHPNSPQIEIAKQLTTYYNNPSTLDNKEPQTKSAQYITFGNIYFEYNKKVAAQFYEKAAILGSLIGFYNLAISLPESEKERSLRLLIIAATNGDEEAETLLKKRFPKIVYHKDIAQTLYQYLLQANKGGIGACVKTQINRNRMGLPNLKLINEEAEYYSSQDDWQYELGMMFLTGNQVTKDKDKALTYLYDAASKGNYTAQYELAKMFKAEDENYYYAFAFCAAINGNAEAIAAINMNERRFKLAQSYIQHLKGEKVNYFTLYLFLYYDYDHKIIDNNTKLIAMACYDHGTNSDYKEINKLLKTQSSWDKKTITYIKNVLANSKKRYHKRVLKRIAKVKIQDKKTEPSIIQTFVDEGFCSNPHPAQTGLQPEFIILPTNFNPSAQSTTTRTNNHYSNTHFHIGQDIGEDKPNRLGVNFRNGQAFYITGANTGTYYTLSVAEF